MPPSPRVLLSIDYEPWFALTRRYDSLAGLEQRRSLDGGFTQQALDPILEMLGSAKASIYLVGEIARWYPEIPQKIALAGHELGLHCQVHRSLVDLAELKQDIEASETLRKTYAIRGYRAPMVGISEDAYPLLKSSGFTYSSSIYAPTGTIIKKSDIWEMPVSTYSIFSQKNSLDAPRKFSTRLLLSGEIPYGSSFMIGLLPDLILGVLERELRAGLSPVIFLHPYEIIRPEAFLHRMAPDLLANPLLLPFTFTKTRFLKTLLKHFPVSPLGTYLDEVLNA